ncbi:MAG: glycosyltransferase [Proteobacteria bacterium]|nr:glycosyltransferase [Pseudomonadota bacterium]
MKVLLVSLYHPELIRGGAQQVCYELFTELKNRPGIEPTLLAAVDPSLRSLYKSGAQITGFDGREGEFIYLSREYDYVWHKGASVELTRSFAEFLELIRPDVVHFHHFHLLGIDLLTLTRRVLPNVRLVLTFHEFMAICDASGHMLRKSDRTLCTKASPVRCHQCFPERQPEHFFTRDMWFKRHLSAVDVFTVPSRFMIERYSSWGLDPAKIVHVTNGQPDYSGGRIASVVRAKRNRFGFFGQLVDNKGVWVILQAVERLRAEGFTDFVIEINGDNLQYASEERRKEFESFIAEENDLPVSERNVVFNGSYSVQQLPQRMARVDWCIVPSVWWEIFGLVISEAWMFKRPVIASNVGGPGERITHEKDGLLFEVADPGSLAQAIQRACSEDGLWQRLVDGITPPASAGVMADGYLSVYTRPAAEDAA